MSLKNDYTGMELIQMSFSYSDYHDLHLKSTIVAKLFVLTLQEAVTINPDTLVTDPPSSSITSHIEKRQLLRFHLHTLLGFGMPALIGFVFPHRKNPKSIGSRISHYSFINTSLVVIGY